MKKTFLLFIKNTGKNFHFRFVWIEEGTDIKLILSEPSHGGIYMLVYHSGGIMDWMIQNSSIKGNKGSAYSTLRKQIAAGNQQIQNIEGLNNWRCQVQENSLQHRIVTAGPDPNLFDLERDCWYINGPSYYKDGRWKNFRNCWCLCKSIFKNENFEPGDERILDLCGLDLPKHTKLYFQWDGERCEVRMDGDISSVLHNIQDRDVIYKTRSNLWNEA